MTTRKMLDELLRIESGLSDWAVGFIDSVDKQMRRHGWVSGSQEAKIEELWRHHCDR